MREQAFWILYADTQPTKVFLQKTKCQMGISPANSNSSVNTPKPSSKTSNTQLKLILRHGTFFMSQLCVL
jgi:hypothetical protein